MDLKINETFKSSLFWIPLILFVLLMLLFIAAELLMPLSIADIKRCEGMDRKFERILINNGIEGISYEGCLPKSMSYFTDDRPILLVDADTEDTSDSDLCKLVYELEISKVLIVGGNYEYLHKSIKKYDFNSMESVVVRDCLR